MIKTIAYLSPEITSISFTFVYKEILALQDRGITVIPISVHKSKIIVKDARVQRLAKNTFNLYQQSLLVVLVSNIDLFLRKPKTYLQTLSTVFKDIISSGWYSLRSWKLSYQFLYASIVAKVIEENSCQYLHIHFAHVPTQIGMYAALLAGIPFSFTSHANDIFENSFLLKEKVARAKAAITISEYNSRFLQEQGIDKNKIRVVRCGIDTKQHQFNARSTFHNPPRIGCLGRLIEKKGMDDLIVALGKLAQKGIDFSLEIGGEGELDDYLNNLALNHNINSKIKFNGAIPNDRVYSWLQELDIFVLACKQDSNGDKDGIPVVLMEAMTAGIPVVSTNISGIPELIKNEKSGFLARPNDVESLAETINKLLHFPHPITQITRQARNRVVEEFDLENNIDRLLNIFNE